ncbi:ATP-binding protein [Stenotrophomonas pennii]|uniref:ATP-binding protein n=1 Tax=Stenotrophomonas lacuserhaii TaxID=2760084 RepID=UPI0032096131
MRTNPFKPGSPVPIGMFAGRIEELKELEAGLSQARAGEVVNYLLTGDRGIGKSSLLLFLAAVARGTIRGLGNENFKFCVVNVQVSDRIGLSAFIKTLSAAIRREAGKTEVVRNFLTQAWDFAQRVKIMDSGVDRAEREYEEELVVNEFALSLSSTVQRLTRPGQGEERFDGLVIVIDEADNACPDLRLGYFLKTLTEELQKLGCDHVAFVVAGLTDVVEKLRQSHESSVRIFHPLPLHELGDEDRKYVIDRGLAHANEINVEKIGISEAARNEIALLSEGYPHFIQQFAFSAFREARGAQIEFDDVINSTYAPNGAIETIGLKYYQSDFYNKIKSDEYRQVLKIMAARGNDWIRKSEIRAEFHGGDTKLTNALQALTSRRIILKDPTKDGIYRLQQRGFALWIQHFGDGRR